MAHYQWLKTGQNTASRMAAFEPLTNVAPAAPRPTLKRIAFGIVLVSILFWGGLAGALYSATYNLSYPGATYVAGQTLFKHTANLTIRRDVSYRSNEEFNKLYHYYSVGFQLGTERYGQSRCILLARTSQWLWRIEQNMSVMLCDAPSDRMIFVMRSFTLRYPVWLRALLPL